MKEKVRYYNNIFLKEQLSLRKYWLLFEFRRHNNEIHLFINLKTIIENRLNFVSQKTSNNRKPI